jgi:large subunit ribosomal protein L7/L12
MADNLQKIADSIEGLSLLDCSKLVKILEERLGVSAAAMAAPAPVAVAAAGGGEEKTAFTVTLKSAGSEKLKAIKLVRDATGLGLAEAKALAESGGVLKQDISKDEAEKMKQGFTEIGATVELS